MSSLLAHVRGNLVAYLALFVALSGTSYAVTALPRNSVGTKQIKRNAVTGAKVKRDTLTGQDVDEAKLAQVPLAARARVADTATTATSATNAVNAANAARAADAATLGGQPPTAFLAAGAKAADSALLDGKPASSFLTTAAQAADADEWDGIDSSVLGSTLTYAGMSFEARDTGATQKNYALTGAINCVNTAEDFTHRVQLPQGALITRLDFRFVDDNAGANSGLELRAYDIFGQTASATDDIASVASNGDNNVRRTASVNVTPAVAVDNDVWSYQLNWSPTICSSEMQLVGAAVHYTLPTG
ncbi:MAG TPA: hypothetical protein VF529_09295 [Solirubrobacteraceae bacterium]|jgi:hypothetical protein